MDRKATFRVINQAKVFPRLFNRNHVHKARRIGGVSPDFAVNLDQALHNDGFRFTTVEGIL